MSQQKQNLIKYFLFKNKKKFFFLSFFLMAFFAISKTAIFFWNYANTPELVRDLRSLKAPGEVALASLSSENLQNFEKKDNFLITDINSLETQNFSQDLVQNDQAQVAKNKIQLPINYTESIKLNISAEKEIKLSDKNAKNFLPLAQNGKAISYKSIDGRKTVYYAKGKNNQDETPSLKNWIIYSSGNGIENESYSFENAILKKGEDGSIQGFFQAQQDKINQETLAQVDGSLMERAMMVIQKDFKEDILNDKNKQPDFILPQPFFIDKNGKKEMLDWEIGDDNIAVSLKIETKKENYPLALDPTVEFTNPGQTGTRTDITGENSSYLGYAMTSGDFNGDGKIDLAVGAYAYGSNFGRTYIFYNDGSISTTAATADVIITGEASGQFGYALASGDFNGDGKTDLAVSASAYFSGYGRMYIFYNDGAYPAIASSADVVISGNYGTGGLGWSMASGDFNGDGKIDLAVGGNYTYNGNNGRVFIFYNDGAYPASTANADITIEGDTTSYFGWSMTSGDFNGDGKTDLAVGGTFYSSSSGRTYIFYNDGSIPTTAISADLIITGENSSWFGSSMVSGDFNGDGKTDLAVGANSYSSNAGRAYIFYNDGSIPTTAATADVIITGEASSQFGYAMTSGDFNGDGKTDLAVGGNWYSTNTGRAYIFYNDGSVTSTAATADVIISGEATNNYFGSSLAAGDFNSDGKADLAVGTYGFSTNLGKVSIFYSNNGIFDSNGSITGNTATSYNNFGESMAAGDFNGDGRVDLAIGTSGYLSNAGVIYIFYNKGSSYPASADNADVKIVGEAGSRFGSSMKSGDFNSDGKIDLAVGAHTYSANTGRVYFFYSNSGAFPSLAISADLIITGEAASDFGYSINGLDANNDGKMDLIIGAYNKDKVYIFYNDGSIPILASAADIIINGVSGSWFGVSMTVGDFNSDGKNDLAVGASSYNTSTGRVYIFYNDGSIPTTAITADFVITGENTNNIFGFSMLAEDFNSDGNTDLIVSSQGYLINTGRVYIFYNDGSMPNSAVSADIIITGDGSSGNFGRAMTSGDYNADGKTDLAIGAYNYSASDGRAYIFYNDGSIPNTAVTADVIITAELGSNLGISMISGDFNGDNRMDLAIGAQSYSSNAGRAYIFYNDGSIPTTAAMADVKINNEPNVLETSFGSSPSFATGDFNGDGKTDLAVGTQSYLTNTGRVYLFYNDGTYPIAVASANVVITGEATNNYFGGSMTAGDFNYDGKTDLAVGAYGYSTNTGRTYVFYNDGSIPITAATADVVITGETTSNYFGFMITSGDFNSDNKTDLAVGANAYSSSIGRTYLFYNDGSIPITAATADIIITGESANNKLGYSLSSGDFNNDGRIDLAIGAQGFNGYVGKAYIFYNDGLHFGTTVCTTNCLAVNADVKINGDGSVFNNFGYFMTSGDFNADGRVDLVIGDIQKCYIFYNDGSIPTTALTADVIIVAETTSDYSSIASGDFNADGKTDLAVGVSTYSSNLGRVYIFYNDGSIPTTAATADVKITGSIANGQLGAKLGSGDINNDGKADLFIGAGAGEVAYFMYTGIIAAPYEQKMQGNIKLFGDFKMK